MNGRQIVRVVRILAMALLTLAPPARAGAPTSKHSGTILAVNRAAGTIVLGEMGPWRVKGGVTEITERTIAVIPSTEFTRVKRVPGPGPAGWAGDFVEVRLGVWEVKAGDLVTVEVREKDQRLIALKVVVIKLGKP